MHKGVNNFCDSKSCLTTTSVALCVLVCTYNDVYMHVSLREIHFHISSPTLVSIACRQ